MDLLVKDESQSQISDAIKDILFAKTAEKIEGLRPDVAASVFDGPEPEVEVETEVEASTDEHVGDEVEYETETEEEE